MKKYITIIIIIIIIVILAVLGLFYYYSKTGPENNSSVTGDKEQEGLEFLVYTDEKWNFEINYLSNWEKENLGADGLTVFAINAPKEESGNSEAGLLVMAINPSSEQVFEEGMQVSIEQLQTAGILISSSKEMISGIDAYKLVYFYVDSFSGQNTKQAHYFFDGDNIWYQILYMATEESFDKYLSEAEQMVQTFKITD